MRYKAIIAYDGTQFYGYQKQTKERTVQKELEKALRLMTQLTIPTFAASRTDKGVHALYQVIHFDTNIDIPGKRWVEALNLRLPIDIRVKSVMPVKETFHARFDAKSKIYLYKISKQPLNAFRGNYEIFVKNFDINKVRAHLKVFEGTHDFTAFSPNKEEKDPLKTIYEFTVKETKTHYIFKIHGNHFLRYMVRSMMGNVIAIGQNQKPSEHLKVMLETKKRSLTAKTAPACALYLSHIYY